MRYALACALLVASPALADKAVEAVVKQNIVGIGNLEDDEKLGLTDASTVITSRGTLVDLTKEDGCVSGAVANAFYGCVQASISHKPGAIVVGVDAAKGFAWFQAPFTSVIEGEDENGKPSKSKTPMRVGGIAVKTGKTWTIVAEQFVDLVTDKELFAGGESKLASGAPKLTGDAKLAGAVAGWFTTGFEGAAAKTGTLIASGTSAAELKSGPAATGLAKSFDKLKIAAISIDAKLHANGAVGFVTAEVRMPKKSGKGAVAMNLAIVVVKDGDTWRWVSFQYQFPTSIG